MESLEVGDKSNPVMFFKSSRGGIKHVYAQRVIVKRFILISSSSPYREANAYTQIGDICKKCGEEMRCFRKKVSKTSSSKELMVGSGVE